jgi:uncharacterized membrane-anchored protein YhcB (DUF1043 family)
MNPYEDEEKRRRDGENLLRVTEEAKKGEQSSKGSLAAVLKKLPIKNLLIGGLIIVACFIGLALSERVSRMGAEVDKMKTQLKTQETALESKLAQSAKENEQLKNELTQVKTELEAMKAESQRRVIEARAAASKKAAAAAAAKKQKKKR